MARFLVGESVQPRWFKTWSLPYMMRDLVVEELDRLPKEDIIEPVQFSEWAAPIVPVLKSDKTVRLCGNYKLTVNQVAKLERCPIPRIEDLYTQLSNSTYFAKLEMRHAYEQIALHPDSWKYVTINTQRGLFTYKPLPYGISSTPGIFQRVMDGLLTGIPNPMVYLNDILITGVTEEEHLATLDQVLTRLESAGFRLQHSKCQFLSAEVTYLGHNVDARGIQTCGDKLKAVLDAPAHSNETEPLQPFPS